MYIPEYYKNQDIEEVKDFLADNSFGILISQDEGRIIGTHIPMELGTNDEGENVLIGHISKANPQSKHFTKNPEVLAIFKGPDSYISSSWYHKEDAPTWNYIAVHIYGKLKINTRQQLVDSLIDLVDKHEKNSENPVSVEAMSPKVLKQIDEIVGFTIEINEIQAAYKLSQNRDSVDYHSIIRELKKSRKSNSESIAEEMKKIRK